MFDAIPIDIFCSTADVCTAFLEAAKVLLNFSKIGAKIDCFPSAEEFTYKIYCFVIFKNTYFLEAICFGGLIRPV